MKAFTLTEKRMGIIAEIIMFYITNAPEGELKQHARTLYAVFIKEKAIKQNAKS